MDPSVRINETASAQANCPCLEAESHLSVGMGWIKLTNTSKMRCIWHSSSYNSSILPQHRSCSEVIKTVAAPQVHFQMLLHSITSYLYPVITSINICWSTDWSLQRQWDPCTSVMCSKVQSWKGTGKKWNWMTSYHKSFFLKAEADLLLPQFLSPPFLFKKVLSINPLPHALPRMVSVEISHVL